VHVDFERSETRALLRLRRDGRIVIFYGDFGSDCGVTPRKGCVRAIVRRPTPESLTAAFDAGGYGLFSHDEVRARTTWFDADGDRVRDGTRPITLE